MLTRLVTAALAAAIVAGLSSSLIQAFTTTPMIIQAEQYEGGGHAAGAHVPSRLDDSWLQKELSHLGELPRGRELGMLDLL